MAPASSFKRSRLPSALTVHRVLSRHYARDPFDGEGARLHGGRWNPPGTALVYTAGTLSLAILELLVHLDSDLLPNDLVAASARLPKTLPISTLASGDLPSDWRTLPAPEALRTLGATWVRSAATAVLQVPSAVIPDEPNFLFNPAHPDFERIEILTPTAFPLDPRLHLPEPPSDPPKQA